MVGFRFWVVDNIRIAPHQTQTIFKQNGMYRNFKVFHHISNWTRLFALTQWNQLKLFELLLIRNWFKSCFHFVHIFSIAGESYWTEPCVMRKFIGYFVCPMLWIYRSYRIEWIGFDRGTTATIYRIIYASMFVTVYEWIFIPFNETNLYYCI